ncbi:MAG: cyclic nucleotide-binding domain-containing protein [Magnetococcales bacterium]|nr:cyclic nucleotide-binding domain-containing protein [Magnetococcales bacterium]
MSSIKEEITVDNVLSFIGEVPGFKSLLPKEVESLIVPMLGVASFVPGQIIIRQRAIAHAVYFLYRGQAKGNIHFEKGDDVNFLIEEGEIFGEMALVSHEKRSATISAVSDVTCFTIDVETFQNIMTNNWRITQAVAMLIGNRRIERLTS